MDRFSKNSEDITVIGAVLTRAIPLVPERYYLGYFLEEEESEFGGLCV